MTEGGHTLVLVISALKIKPIPLGQPHSRVPIAHCAINPLNPLNTRGHTSSPENSSKTATPSLSDSDGWDGIRSDGTPKPLRRMLGVVVHSMQRKEHNVHNMKVAACFLISEKGAESNASAR